MGLTGDEVTPISSDLTALLGTAPAMWNALPQRGLPGKCPHGIHSGGEAILSLISVCFLSSYILLLILLLNCRSDCCLLALLLGAALRLSDSTGQNISFNDIDLNDPNSNRALKK